MISVSFSKINFSVLIQFSSTRGTPINSKRTATQMGYTMKRLFLIQKASQAHSDGLFLRTQSGHYAGIV